MGAFNYCDPVKYCADHKPVRCGKVIEVAGGYYSSFVKTSAEPGSEGEDSNAERCDFDCCEGCIDTHICGDDPNDYL
jgi:hypothetical protein